MDEQEQPFNLPRPGQGVKQRSGRTLYAPLRKVRGVRYTHSMIPPLLGSSRLQVSANQVSTTLAGEVVILDVKAGMYFGLNAVGARFWSLAQEPVTLDRAVDAVVAEFDVPREQAASDLAALAGDLVERGLLDVVAAPTP